jgi:hypothetical protein
LRFDVGTLLVSFDPSVDVGVKGHQESIGLILKDDFDPLRIVLMVKEVYILFDQFDGGFINSAVERDGSVAIDFTSGASAEEVGEIFGGGSEKVKMMGITIPRGFLCGAMNRSVIDLIAPSFEFFIEDGKSKRGGQKGKKLHSEIFEQPLDFSFSFGPVRSAVNKGDPQGGRGVRQLVRAVRRPIVKIKFSGKPPLAQGFYQAVGEAFEIFL